MNECDRRIDVLGVGEKDACKGRSEIREKCRRVARWIDRVDRVFEQREGIELRERVGKCTEVAASQIRRKHLDASDRLRRLRASGGMTGSGKRKVFGGPVCKSV